MNKICYRFDIKQRACCKSNKATSMSRNVDDKIHLIENYVLYHCKHCSFKKKLAVIIIFPLVYFNIENTYIYSVHKYFNRTRIY